jgi:hypothetical protein
VEYETADHKEADNHFGFIKVELNLPCAPEDVPSKHQANANGESAGDCCMCCDDGKAIGQDENHCQKRESNEATSYNGKELTGVKIRAIVDRRVILKEVC